MVGPVRQQSAYSFPKITWEGKVTLARQSAKTGNLEQIKTLLKGTHLPERRRYLRSECIFAACDTKNDVRWLVKEVINMGEDSKEQNYLRGIACICYEFVNKEFAKELKKSGPISLCLNVSRI